MPGPPGPKSDARVLYTEHASLRTTSCVMSLWSYVTRSPGSDAAIRRRRAVDHEYWLERSDPLLTTILPGTNVSLIVNYGDLWTLADSSQALPRLCVAGPVTRARTLCFGGSIDVIGAVIP